MNNPVGGASKAVRCANTIAECGSTKVTYALKLGDSNKTWKMKKRRRPGSEQQRYEKSGSLHGSGFYYKSGCVAALDNRIHARGAPLRWRCRVRAGHEQGGRLCVACLIRTAVPAPMLTNDSTGKSFGRFVLD